MIKTLFFSSLIFVCGYATPSRESPLFSSHLKPLTAPKDFRLDLQREEVFIHPDNTYEMILTYERTILTENGLLNHQTMASPSYFPSSNQVEALEAYTLQPDGTKIDVPKDNIFTLNAPADPSAPGFVTALEQHVAFPHVKIGSTLHVKWRYLQTKPPMFPFADVMSPSFDTDTLQSEMIVNVPKGMHLKWAKEGDFQVQETTEGDRHIVKGSLGPQTAGKRELFMTASADFLPFFEVSTIPSWEEIGNTVSKITTPSQTVTPEITALVKTIVGNAKGKEAAQAIYNWTANHIAYLETEINTRQGFIPPQASEIIANRFGDCKAHSCVLQTMLKIVGIPSYPVLVNWNNALKQYPLPMLNFDHEMVFVPSLNLFLNPTDQYSTFSAPLEQTNFDPQSPQVLANKPVLIAKPKSSMLTKTPEATPEQNQYRIESQMQMNMQGSMQGKGSMKTTGCFADAVRGLLSESSTLNTIVNKVALNNGIKGKAIATGPDLSDLDAPMNLEYSWEGQNLLHRNEDDILFQVPVAVDFFTSQFFVQYLSSEPRKYPLIIGASIYEWDHSIALPVNYQIKKPLPSIRLVNPAGSYIATYKEENGSLQVHRILTLKKNVYPAEEYVHVGMLIEQLLQDRSAIFSLSPVSSIKSNPTKQP